MSFTRFILVKALLLLLLPHVHNKEIFLKHDANSKYCLSTNSCDGSEQSPSGSFLDALEVVFSSNLPEGEWFNIFLEEDFSLTEMEGQEFMNMKNKSKLVFANEIPNKLKRIKISGIKGDGGQRKTSLVMDNIFFTFELRSLALKFENINLTLVEEGKFNFFNDSDTFLFGEPGGTITRSELSFENVSMTISTSGLTLSKEGSIISCADPTSLELKFSDFSLNISGGLFSYFIVIYTIKEKGNPSQEVTISFNNCFFSMDERLISVCKSKFYRSIIFIYDSEFHFSDFFQFEFEQSNVVIEGTNYFLSTLKNEFHYQNASLSFQESAVSFSNSSIFG